MIRRSATVAIAVTLQQLAAGKTSGWTEDQELVLKALRRSKTTLNDATDEELSDYLSGMTADQMQGVAANVKGIFHELLVARAENFDGDEMSALLFEATNHPGADVEFLMRGEYVSSIQLKAVQDPEAILEHFSRYPDINVMATSEVTEALRGQFVGRLSSSGFSNVEISQTTRETLEELAGESLGEFIQDGVVTSILVGGALQAKAVLSGERIDARQIRSFLELAGIGAATALTVDALLNVL